MNRLRFVLSGIGTSGFVLLIAFALTADSLFMSRPAANRSQLTLRNSTGTFTRGLTALPADLVPAVAQTLASRSPDTWRARITGQTALFSNPAQRLTMRFNRHGTALELDDKQYTHVTLNLTAYRSGHSTHPVLAGTPSVHGNRVEFARGSGITEWYVNSPLGVEQGFTLAARPPSAATKPTLTLAFSLHGNLEPLLKDNALNFRNSQGKAVLRYGDLLAWDSRQHKLPTRMQLENHRLLLSVDTTDAVFPVTLDPLFSAVTTFTDPLATAGDYFGSSVALSSDGNTALIGAWGATVSGQQTAGAAYVYGRSNGAWLATPLQTFTDPGATSDDFFGFGVALSGDGNTALIGAPGANAFVNGDGATYVYSRSNGVWSATPLQTFTDPPTKFADSFGHSVALSGDGNTALIGAVGTTVSGQDAAGAAYVYGRSDGAWSATPLQTFTDPLASAGDWFGISVAMSGDGSTALIGASGTVISGQAFVGAAYVYGLNNGAWSATPFRTFTDPPGVSGDYFGESVALPGDDNTALIGANFAGSGQARAGVAYGFSSAADLSLGLDSSPASVNVNGSVTYMLTITNADTQVTAENLTLTDMLPAGMTFVSANAASGACSNSSGTVTCTLPSLAPQATWQPSIAVTATATGSLTNTVTVSADTPDPNSANNTANITTSVTSASSTSGGGSIGLLSLLLLAPLLRRRRA